jgi:RHS repeat-associated protein
VQHATNGLPLETVTEYRYDLRDRRIAVIQSGTVTWTYFALENPIADIVGNEETPVARYVYGEGADELLAIWRRDEGMFFPFTDHLRTIYKVVDEEADEVASYMYDSFGNRISASGTNPAAAGRFGYKSRELDSVTGLIYFRARWYDPDLGQFLSEDPIGFAARDANLYRFAGNRPLRFNDPSGTVTATEYAILSFLTRVAEVAALCDLGNDVHGLWSFVASSVENAVNGLGGPTVGEVNDAVSGALPNYCDLSPINPGCVINCN